MLIVMSSSADDIIGNDSLEALPTWMSKLHEALDNHLDRFDSPELEIMPLIGESVSACGQHAAFQTHQQYFCLFACCAKTLSRLCCHSLNEVSRKPEEAILKLARLLLVVQPEDYRAWNLLKRDLDPKKETQFAHFILTKHPRSSETYVQLRYLAMRQRGLNRTMGICKRGFTVCDKAASSYRDNYHAWDHRRFLALMLLEDEVEDQIKIDILQTELDVVGRWRESHISDSCPFKYRLFLVLVARARSLQLRFSFDEELRDLNRLMATFPGHETLWDYRRELVASIGLSEETFDLVREKAFVSNMAVNLSDPVTKWEMTLRKRYLTFLENLNPL